MNIQRFAGTTQPYSAAWTPHSAATATATATTGAQAASTSSSAQVTLSDQARALLSSDSAVAARLDSIKSKPAVERSDEEVAFLQRNDKQFAEIIAKDPRARTADEIDCMQKAGGLVNTMANLTSEEKQLYDELVAKGDTEAVRGMNLIALSRMNSGDVTLPGGKTFDPTQTGISADTVRKLFSQMFVSQDGHDARSFEALAKCLDRQTAALIN